MRIKNWARFQHFKDRKPPWVKLYRDILDDMQWHELDPKAAKVLTMLWLIASEDDGNLPDNKTLAFRLRMTESEIKACCSKLSHWLEDSDITPISTGYQDDPLETERETERYTSRESSTKGTALPADWKLPDEWRVWAIQNRGDIDVDTVADSFRDYWVAKPGKDGRKTDWLATWRNWVRNQKTGIRGQQQLNGLSGGIGHFV